MIIKKIAIILIIILFAALAFQLARSYILTHLIKNINEDVSLEKPVNPEIPPGFKFEKYLIVSDKEEVNSNYILEQLINILQYMKKDYSIISPENTLPEPLEEFDLVIFTFERLDNLQGLDDYIDYVKKGGTLFFAQRPVIDGSFKKISGILGIEKLTSLDDSIGGISMDSDVLLGSVGFKSKTESFKNSSLEVAVNSDIKLLISSYQGLPLAWKANYGEGTFLVFNGTMLNEKNNRGLFAALISSTMSHFIYPIANIKMVHIDDFPAPIPSGTDEQIYEEFNRDIQQFYRQVWWSDMVRMARKYKLKYTGFVIENYGNDTTPPLSGPRRSDVENLLVYGKELLNMGGELGLHGYNHQSLVPEGYIKQDLGYNPWPSQSDMELSIVELMNFIHEVFPYYNLKAYVPPSNILSKEGRSAVISANEQLEVISSVYLPDAEGDVYLQEFEVAADGIVEFPRISAGYIYNDEVMWSIYNGMNLPGIFAHFIHPDDILDPDRSQGKSWTELSREYDSLLGEVQEKYSWLNSYTISEGSAELKKYIQCKPLINYSGRNIEIYCQNYRPDIYLLFRTEDAISETENVTYKKVSENTYLLTLKDSHGRMIIEAGDS